MFCGLVDRVEDSVRYCGSLNEILYSDWLRSGPGYRYDNERAGVRSGGGGEVCLSI